MYLILWEFVVPPEHLDAFLAAYAPDGDWAQLFRRAEGYLGTDLLRSTTTSEDAASTFVTFVTIDRWQTEHAMAVFQQRFGEDYRALDARLEGLTLRETKLGTFLQ